MPLKIEKISFAAFVFVLVLVSTAMAADEAPQPASTADTFAEWGYILRGALFIFASALAMVWIGRKLSKRQK